MAVLFLALKRNGRRAGATLAIAIAAGFSLFLILFLLYCSMKGLNPAEPLRYIVGAGERKSGLSLGFKARILLETAVWFQPPLLAAFAGAWILRAKRWFRERRFDGREILGAFAVAVLGGYALVGGTAFGFPRYFIPAIAPMVLFTATSLRDEDWPDFGRPPALFALLFAVILLGALVVGDPILTWRFELREALAFGETGAFRGVLSKFALQAAMGCLLPIAVWTWFLRPKTLGQAVAALLLAAVTQGAGLAAAQGLGDYNLTYNYGERGIPGVVDEIARRYSPGERVLATLDITGSLQLRDVEALALPLTVWASVENFTRELEDPATTYVAYSVSGNTVQQLREVLLSVPIQNRLRRDFTPQDFGGYRLWIRR